jgi:hypothetical protein
VTSLVWEMDQTGPAATGVSLTRLPGSTVVDQVLIQFSEPLATGSLTLADLTLHLDGGPDLIGAGIVVLQPETAAAYRLSGLGSVASAEGGYTLVVNQAGVTDVLGNAGEGLKEFSWLVDDTAPAAVASIRIDPDNGISDTDLKTNVLEFTLLGSVAEPGLTVSVFDVTRGRDLGQATVTGLDFTLDVALTSAGNHRLRVRAADPSGNFADSFFDVVIDLTVPAVVGFQGVPSQPVSRLNQIDVVLTEPVDMSTFDWTALRLRRDGGPNLIDDSVQITPLAGVYRISPLDHLLTEDGSYELQVVMTGVADEAGNLGVDTSEIQFQIQAASVLARHVFYNRSSFDGNNAEANEADDQAIAVDKWPLLPGELAGFGNYTSYVHGINGIMVDVARLADSSQLNAANFEFRVGNTHDPSKWATGPAPGSITLRAGAGVGGGRSDHVDLAGWGDPESVAAGHGAGG